MVEAWIFDLGNTLMSIPDEFDEEACLQRILGYSDVDEVRSIIYRLCDRFRGQTAAEFLSRFDAAVNPDGRPQLSQRLLAAWRQSIEHASLKPGALEVLDLLREHRVKLALVSNTPPTSAEIIERLALAQRFDAVILSCDVGYLKPDPRIFQLALGQLDVPATDAVVVGDKIRTDILGGAIIGMRSILVEERLRSAIENGQHYVDAIVPTLHDLKNTRLWREML